MSETTGVMPVFGPIRPSLFALRGIRFLEGEDGAGAGAETDETEEDADDSADSENETENDDSGSEQEDPLAKLKKALKSERDAHRAAQRDLKAAKQELADKDKPADEQALDQARREAEQTATEKANARIVRSELKAAAAGKVKRLDLLLAVTDLTAIEVDENGDPDTDALNDAVTTFLEEYPELAVDASKFTGSADQGSKGKQTKPGQLTREDIKNMSPEQINEARAAGRMKKLGY